MQLRALPIFRHPTVQVCCRPCSYASRVLINRPWQTDFCQSTRCNGFMRQLILRRDLLSLETCKLRRDESGINLALLVTEIGVEPYELVSWGSIRPVAEMVSPKTRSKTQARAHVCPVESPVLPVCKVPDDSERRPFLCPLWSSPAGRQPDMTVTDLGGGKDQLELFWRNALTCRQL